MLRDTRKCLRIFVLCTYNLVLCSGELIASDQFPLHCSCSKVKRKEKQYCEYIWKVISINNITKLLGVLVSQKSSTVRWAEHMTCVGAKTNSYVVVVENVMMEREFGKPKRRRKILN